MPARPQAPRTLNLGLVQSPCGPDRDANVHRALEGIAEAAARGAGLVVLQELFGLPYPCQREDPAVFEQAETVPGPTVEALAGAARQHGCAVVGSVFERRAPGLYHNTAVVLDADGGLLGSYRKMHVPDDPLYYEKFYFAPGDTRPPPAASGAAQGTDGFACFATRAARVGPLVCWDQWYPEAARLTALLDAQVLVYPTAIGWLAPERDSVGAEQREAWEVMHRAHAIANGVFVAAANRVGTEGGIEFWGGSLVCDPFGRVLVRGPPDREAVLVVECDLGQIERTRREWPFLRDRRVDAYGGLGARWLADRPPGAPDAGG